MYNSKLVELCKTLVANSINNRTQVRTHFGSAESDTFIKFKQVANSVGFNYAPVLIKTPFNELVYQIHCNGNYHHCHCGKPTDFISIAKGYSAHCSKECKYSDPAYIQKQKDAKAKRTAEQIAEADEKRKQTNLQRFGHEYTMQNESMVAKQLASRGKSA